MDTQHIRVSARVRPALKEGRRCVHVDTELGRVSVDSPDIKSCKFDFTSVFDEKSSQELVYAETTKHVVDGFVSGMNGTVFAYGQTGSGKTYTMLGPELGHSSSKRGVMPRAICDVFTQLEEQKTKLGVKFNYVVRVSFLELYNERIYDLLNRCVQVEYREIEHREIDVQNSEDCLAQICEGWAQRTVGSTAMNDESSRSHAIVTLLLLTNLDEDGIIQKRSSRLHLVDLAGSERQGETKAGGDRLREACSINKSLSTLSQVIRSLSSVRPPAFINFRDSLLTRMLQEALGGNSRTSVIINLHCMAAYLNDTLSSLRFATNVKKIKNNAKVNENVSGTSADVLQAKITELNEALRVAVEARQQAESRALLNRDCNTSIQYESDLLIEERKKYEEMIKELKDTIQYFQNKLAKLEYHNNVMQASNKFILDGFKSNTLTDMVSYRKVMDKQFDDAVANFQKDIDEGFLSNVSDLNLRRCRDEILQLKRELEKKNDQLEHKTKDFEELTTELCDLKQRFNDNETVIFSPPPTTRLRQERSGYAASLKRKNALLKVRIVELTQVLNERHRYFDEMNDSENSQLQTVCAELCNVSADLKNIKNMLTERENRIVVLEDECLRLRTRIQRADATVTTLSKEKSELEEYCSQIKHEIKELVEQQEQSLADAPDQRLKDRNIFERNLSLDFETERKLLDVKITLDERDNTIEALRAANREKDKRIDVYRNWSPEVLEEKCEICVEKAAVVNKLEEKLNAAAHEIRFLTNMMNNNAEDAEEKIETYKETTNALEERLESLTTEYKNVCRELRILVSVVLESTITNTESRLSVFGSGCLNTYRSEFELICERLKNQRRELNDFELTRVGLENELDRAEQERDDLKTELNEIKIRQTNLETMLNEKTKEANDLYQTMSESAGQRNPKQNIRYLDKIRENLQAAEKKLSEFQRNCRCNPSKR